MSNKLHDEQIALNVKYSTDNNYPSYAPIMGGQARVSELPESKPIMNGKPPTSNKPVFGYTRPNPVGKSNMPTTQIYQRNP